jgi:putative ABC transport system permease protein
VSAGYLPAMGIPVIAGRNFRDGDTAESPTVALVSASFARRYWPGEDAVGKRLRFDDASEDSWITVVGVAGDSRQLGLHEDAPPILYMPYTQFTLPFTNLAVRSSAPAGTVATLVRGQLAAIDPELPPGTVVTLDEVLDRSVEQPRFRTMVLVGFASLALVLAAVGVYGLIGFSVAQRTREIGIRVALGAQPRQVMIQVIREGLVLAVAGVAIGLVAALAASRAIDSFLFGIDPFDPATFGGVAVVLLAVAFLACYIPSRKALSVDPIVALRTE